ncbi:MAG: DUF362 domain-containing protein [candidate division Zixibacteria bacterium]
MSSDDIKRRDFIKLTGKATILTAVMGGGGYLLSKNEYSPSQTRILSADGDRGIQADDSLPDLASVKGKNHYDAALTAIGLIGGIERFISKGDIVTIKPNIGWDRTPEQGANTNPVLVKTVAELCFDAGAKKVIVTDVPCNDARRTFARSGIQEMAGGTGAEIILPEDRFYVRADLGGEILGVWPVIRQFLETDKLINMPVVKHHSLSLATIGMKNWYGVMGGPRNRLHQQIDTSIADLADFFRPTLVIVDATRVMIRNGPVGGRLSDVEIHDTVIASTDQVAADSYCCGFLGLSPAELKYIALTESRGLGKSSGYTIIEKELA